MTPTTTTPVPAPIVGRARAAAQILEHAQRTGLPLPFNIDLNDHSSPIGLLFGSIGDLAEWALWIGAVVVEESHPDRVHHIATGFALEQPVRLVRVEHTAVAR